MITEILQNAIELEASDIIISCGNYPAIKKSGEVIYLKDYEKLSQETLEQEIISLIPEKLKEKFTNELEIDFSISMNTHRFRVNGFKQKS